jgi:FkbM family methyltransferase
MLAGRPLSMVLKEAVEPRNYLATARMMRRLVRPIEGSRRYLLGQGTYPYVCELRTPCGPVSPTLYSHHDMWTVNEVFCREDYATGPDARTIVDIGSNIGVSALYFLTRSRHSRIWLFEPVPRNVDRLRANLAGFEGRWKLREAAVAQDSGSDVFGVEDSGRYGGIGVDTGRMINVTCVGINDVLEEVLDAAPVVDVLKIDTEGSELEILQAIRPELLIRVRTAYLEVERQPESAPEAFESAFHNQTWVLRNRTLTA